jgi:hypothetical protein
MLESIRKTQPRRCERQQKQRTDTYTRYPSGGTIIIRTGPEIEPVILSVCGLIGSIGQTTF